MTRATLTLVLALILLAAFALGWLAHWAVRRLFRTDPSNLSALERMADALGAAEAERDQAVAWAQAREAELQREIKQLRAELDAAMTGLRNARAELDALRRRLSAEHD